jgi:hypothetical protein
MTSSQNWSVPWITDAACDAGRKPAALNRWREGERTRNVLGASHLTPHAWAGRRRHAAILPAVGRTVYGARHDVNRLIAGPSCSLGAERLECTQEVRTMTNAKTELTSVDTGRRS